MLIQQATEILTLFGSFMRKVVIKLVHDCLDNARGIRGRTVAVDPALGVNDVGNRCSCSAYGKTELGSASMIGSTFVFGVRNSTLYRLVNRR